MSESKGKGIQFRRPLLRKFLRGLSYVGITVDVFVTVREGERTIEAHQPENSFNFGFLDITDIDEMIRLEPTSDRKLQLDRFANGKLCFGIKEDQRLVAKMWCDLDEFNYQPNYRKLDADEAYLFSAYADPSCRGQNLAPRMRAACYEALQSLGRTRFCSFTNYFNNSARRFKEKLGARNEALRVFVDVFGMWSRTFTLRTYERELVD